MPYVSGMLSTRQQTRVGSLAAARVSSVRKGAKTGCSSQQQSLFTRHFAACWLYNVNTSRFPCFSSEQSDCHSQRDRLSFQEKLFGTRIVYKDNRLKLKSSYHYHFKNSVGHQTYKCVLLITVITKNMGYSTRTSMLILKWIHCIIKVLT